MSRRLVLTTSLLAVALLTALVTWWTLRAPLVPAVSAAMAPLVRTLQFSARVATQSRVEIGSTLTARVLQVAVAEGAMVKEGDVLIRLESAELKASLAQAEAAGRQAAARLTGLRAGVRVTPLAPARRRPTSVLAGRAGRTAPHARSRGQGLPRRGAAGRSRRASCSGARPAWTAARAQCQPLDQGRAPTSCRRSAQLALARLAADAAARARLAQETDPRRPAARACCPRCRTGPDRAARACAADLGTGQPVAAAGAGRRALPGAAAAGPVPRPWSPTRYPRSVSPPAPARIAPRSMRSAAHRSAVFRCHTGPDFLREDMTLSVEVRRRSASAHVWCRWRRCVAVRQRSGARDVVRAAQEGRVRAQAGAAWACAARRRPRLSMVWPTGEHVLIGTSPAPGQRVRPQVVDTASRTQPSAGIGTGRERGRRCHAEQRHGPLRHKRDAGLRTPRRPRFLLEGRMQSC